VTLPVFSAVLPERVQEIPVGISIEDAKHLVVQLRAAVARAQKNQIG